MTENKATVGRPPVLILNAYGPFLRRPLSEALHRAGFEAMPALGLENAVEIARSRKLAGVVVGLNLRQGTSGEVLESGLSLFARFLAEVGDPGFATRPIVVTVTHRSSSGVVDEEAARHGIANPRLLASKADVLDPAFAGAMREHFALGW